MSNAFTKEEQEAFIQIIDRVSNHYRAWLTKQIQDGKGNPVWDGIKQSRSEFGEGVYAPFLRFETTDEIDAFLDEDQLPGEKLPGAYIDTTCIDDFIKHTGGSFSKEQLTEQIGELMEAADQPWEQPVMVFVILGFLELQDGANLTLGSRCMVDWWDTEAETVPYPGITKKKVRQYLAKDKPRMVTLSTRNPLQAGKNMNAWMDICREKKIAVIIDAETLGATKDLTDENKEMLLPVSMKG